MKKATVAPAKPKREFSFVGVVGTLIPEDVTLGLVFGPKTRISPYDAQLDRLAENPGHWLRFDGLQARPSIMARATKKKMRVECAEKDGNLYVRFLGSIETDLHDTRRKRIRSLLLKAGPLNHMRLAARLRDDGDLTADGPICEAICMQMVRDGELVRQEGGAYALAPKAGK